MKKMEWQITSDVLGLNTEFTKPGNTTVPASQLDVDFRLWADTPNGLQPVVFGRMSANSVTEMQAPLTWGAVKANCSRIDIQLRGNWYNITQFRL